MPELAEGWTSSNGGRSLIVRLRPGLKFHDGTPADAKAVAAVLPTAMKPYVGPIIDDVDHVTSLDDTTFEIAFKRPSPLLLESLEAMIRKPGPTLVGTGPFMIAGNSPTELRANPNFHSGKPRLDDVRVQTFPSVRTAWAELLRNHIDMLWEVGPDAFDSLQSSTSVSVFKFTRRYQYTIAFNPESPPLRSPVVRRALNVAIDRGQLVRRALNDRGLPSTGPIWPKYWALGNSTETAAFDPLEAARLLGGKRVQFTLQIVSDEIYERVALELKRQLAAVGVEMNIQAGSQDDQIAAQRARTYDAVLVDSISAPTVLRVYQRWHREGAVNPGRQGNATVDAALDRVRRAEDEPRYREAISNLQRAFREDPPAIFLLWKEHARAVSRRFAVTTPEQDQDVLGTMYQWAPRNDEGFGSRN